MHLAQARANANGPGLFTRGRLHARRRLGRVSATPGLNTRGDLETEIMKRPVTADLVRAYLHAVGPLYASREPANMRSALARLVATEGGPPTRHRMGRRAPHKARSDRADELSAEQLTRKARKLAENLEISRSYRRACLARWRRFLTWAVEHEHTKAEELVRFDAACRSIRFRK